MTSEKLFSMIDDRKDELFALLSKLISINSESTGAYGNEEECARFIHAYCEELGMESDLFSPLELEGFTEHPDYLPGRNLEKRYNVVARYCGEENEDELLLMSHTDTVRIGDLADWEREPLSGEICDGKIYGRGACDDKYGLAALMFIAKLLKAEGYVPKKNWLLGAYSDEEYGGSHGALATVLKYPAPKIVSMDGREGQIWHCGSGGQEVKYHFHTKETADSAKAASRGIGVVMDVIEEQFAEKRRSEMEANSFYAGTIIPKTALRYMGTRGGNNGSDLGKGEVYFVYYTDKTKDEIWEEFRALEVVLNEKLAPLGLVGDGFTPATRFFHYVHCAPDSADICTMIEAAKEATGSEPIVCGSCLSDLSVISKHGSSAAFAFGCGRDFSKKGGAHQPNEFMECETLVNYTKTIAAYILKVLG